ncbi:MAG TPA: DEAD/DEAH box helicase [Nitriliruptorales bacterium]
MPPAEATDDRAQALLELLAGPGAVLRADQAEAISALVDDRRRVLLVQATGWGKSAVYWIATALNRSAGGGPTLVVSPLLALMRDQVEAASRMGLAAETVNSTNVDAWTGILERLDRDEIDVLLISPERLNAASFRPRLDDLTDRLGMLVVDEAHAVSDWSHDFRPDYGRIVTLLERVGDDVPVLACTATANARVVEDVEGQIGRDTVTFRGPLGRESLSLAVLHLQDGPTRLAWLAAYVAQHRPVRGHAGIVYTLTVDDAERTADFLTATGLDVRAYSSRLAPDDREQAEADLKANRLDAVVATSALGMGYDKPDLAFVAHLGAPSSPIAYYQQVGRAGRAIDHAEVVLLPTGKDERIWRHFDLDGIPSESETSRVLDALDVGQGRPPSVPMLELEVNVRRTRLDLLLKVLDVAGAVTRQGAGWALTGQPYAYDAERYRSLAQARRREHDAMRALLSRDFDGCLMRFLTDQLDDPATDPCGRCGGCTGWQPEVEIDPEVLEQARTFLRDVDVPLFARRQWASGLEDAHGVGGRIDVERRPQVGRALTTGDDGWTDLVDRVLLGEQAALDEAVAGIAEVLARWSWPARPTQVVPVPSPRHADLNAKLAARIGALGRLPVRPALLGDPDRPPQQEQANGPHKAANALATYRRDPSVALDRGPVLLVDTAHDSGWTAAVCAWLLTQDHSHLVLPLALTTRLPVTLGGPA